MNKALLKENFLLDPRITFLNHGSFGATPKPVMQNYQRWQTFAEFQPVLFYGRQVTNLVEESRKQLADYLKVNKNQIVYVPNATTGMNIIARSLALGENHTVLTTNHEYGAVDKTWRFLSEKYHFKIQRNEVSIPITDDAQIIRDVFKNVDPSVKVLSISHITSPTAVVFPVKEICALARKKGILTVIDGAHAPGQIELDLKDLDCDFYVGNLHKWLCAPKGSAFLYADPSVERLLEPLIVSWGWQSEKPSASQMVDNLEWTGTRDISAYLAVPEAITFFKNRIQGDPQEKCLRLAQEVTEQLSRITDIPSLYATQAAHYRQMASAIIESRYSSEELKTLLYEKYRVEIPVITWNNKTLIRYSFQIYNDEKDAQTLLHAMHKLI